jgi:hypothetical protein
MINIPTIAGNNTTVPLLPTNPQATFIQLYVSGSGVVRFGGIGSNGTPISATVGIPITGGSYYTTPFQGQSRGYSVGGFNVYVPAGMTVDAAYEPFS